MADKPNIYQRINAVMAKVDYVQKEQKQGMRYSVVSHDAVTAKLRTHIQEAGIVYHPVMIDAKQNGNRTELTVVVRFANMDNPDEYIDVPSLGYGIDEQDKGPGKAMSYAVKYALLKTFGLETGDDPDSDQNVVHKPTSKRVEPPKATQTSSDDDPWLSSLQAAPALEVASAVLDGPGMGRWEESVTISVTDVKRGVGAKGPWERVNTPEMGLLWNNSKRPMVEGEAYAVLLQGDSIRDWKL